MVTHTNYTDPNLDVWPKNEWRCRGREVVTIYQFGEKNIVSCFVFKLWTDREIPLNTRLIPRLRSSQVNTQRHKKLTLTSQMGLCSETDAKKTKNKPKRKPSIICKNYSCVHCAYHIKYNKQQCYNLSLDYHHCSSVPYWRAGGLNLKYISKLERPNYQCYSSIYYCISTYVKQDVQQYKKKQNTGHIWRLL